MRFGRDRCQLQKRNELPTAQSIPTVSGFEHKRRDSQIANIGYRAGFAWLPDYPDVPEWAPLSTL